MLNGHEWKSNILALLYLLSALIESDAEGIGGSGFVECIREHIHSVCPISSLKKHTKICSLDLMSNYNSGHPLPHPKQGWTCQLTEEQFIAVKELVCSLILTES